MVAKINALEERLQCAIDEAKRSVSPKYQTEKRPWLMTGLSLATGYVAGRIVFGAAPRRQSMLLQENRRQAVGANQQKATLVQTVSGMLSGVVTAVGVSLAREFATNLLMKRHRGGEYPDGPNGAAGGYDERYR
jgi:hypothetical protein